jgi:hypothetical protein
MVREKDNKVRRFDKFLDFLDFWDKFGTNLGEKN